MLRRLKITIAQSSGWMGFGKTGFGEMGLNHRYDVLNIIYCDIWHRHKYRQIKNLQEFIMWRTGITKMEGTMIRDDTIW